MTKKPEGVPYLDVLRLAAELESLRQKITPSNTAAIEAFRVVERHVSRWLE